MLAQTPLPALNIQNIALFLDFDGTLAPIVRDPAIAEVPERTLQVLERLKVDLDGAVAIVSGRSITELDRLLSPLHLPIAGVHGTECRSCDGQITRCSIDDHLLFDITRLIDEFVRARSGLIKEQKSGSVTLHYRQSPIFQQECEQFAEGLVNVDRRVGLLRGKMVFEFKLSGQTKGDAIGAFMAEPPFIGRTPVFAGDDLTDEDAFRALTKWDGISVKVGEERSIPRYRVSGIGELHEWLQSLVGTAAINDQQTP
jgi:trehalose 6-phosphate phosphatase